MTLTGWQVRLYLLGLICFSTGALLALFDLASREVAAALFVLGVPSVIVQLVAAFRTGEIVFTRRGGG